MPLSELVTLEFEPARDPALDDDALEALAWEAKQLVEDSIAPRLRSEAERAMWEDIEAASLVELGCERLAAGQLDIVFAAHWELGAGIAAHWYAAAIAAARPELEQAFRARGCALTAVRADELTTVVVERDGELAIEPAAPGARCSCGPCAALRT